KCRGPVGPPSLRQSRAAPTNRVRAMLGDLQQALEGSCAASHQIRQRVAVEGAEERLQGFGEDALEPAGGLDPTATPSRNGKAVHQVEIIFGVAHQLPQADLLGGSPEQETATATA